MQRLIQKLKIALPVSRFIIYPEKGSCGKCISLNQHFLAKICFCAYILKLEFQTENSSRRRQRKRNITWFNPPFSDNVSTNIGRKILNLLDKHFPPDHKLHPICNRSCVKVSYSCMPNMSAIIKQHNSNVASPRKTDETKLAENCNC